ncbi:vicilin-like seed storage protein At2g18540 [Benincasa hispida]|uniref:vicilin-like seed storage protein At2g18540 n=1 Tax=Benincasa hispida TaxID=102211 RepID=UPI0018FFA340|nr:vicilin-like seed storage protein At2g18540 [Benincasa hispida]
MADQSPQPSSLPSSPLKSQLSMREAAFLTANRRLSTQPHTIPQVAGRPWQNPLAARPLQFKREQSSESTLLPTFSSESEKKRQDDKEVFGRILNNLEKGGGLPEARVVDKPLPLEEEMEEASRRSALALLDLKETGNAESSEGPIRVALEEEVAEKQSEVAEEKKKKIKEKRVEGDEEAHPIKKKEKRTDEKKERKREERRLKKKEERRNRAESLELDGESTSVREDKGESVQLRESA